MKPPIPPNRQPWSRRTAVAAVLVLLGSCAAPASEPQEIARLPIDRLDEILTRDGVELDAEITHDGGGSLRIAADGPRVVRLAEIEDPDVENARLLYRAWLRSENLEGQAYLEMWCVFEKEGKYFSRGLDAPLSGTVDWTAREISFFLQAGQNPVRLELNVVVDGRGTVWIDDARVARGPLP